MLEPIDTDLEAWIAHGLVCLQAFLDKHQAFVARYGA
jgi:hypothetical protein